jgi:hypothetical protein
MLMKRNYESVLNPTVSSHLLDYIPLFTHFLLGVIKEAFLMYNRDTGEPRGFGFISFDSEETVEYLLAKSELTFEIDGRRVSEYYNILPNWPHLIYFSLRLKRRYPSNLNY